MRSPPALRRALLPIAGSIALGAALLWPALTPKAADRRVIGGAGEDFVRQVVPWRTFVADTWAAGKVPLWNPHQYAGTPVLADPQQAVLYPWRWLQVPLAIGPRRLPLWAVTLEAVAHLALGALFAGWLARRLGAGRPGAALAALAFGAGGYLTGYPVVQLAVLDTAVWLPATLAALAAATAAADGPSRRRWAAAAAAATALAVLAGHPQTAGYVVAAGGLWLAAALVARAAARASTRRGDAGASGVGGDVVRAPWAAGALAAGGPVATIAAIWLGGAAVLSMVQWWPTLELARQAARTLSEGEVLAGLPVGDVVQLVAPHVVSRWSPLYVGIVPLVVGAWGAVRARTGRGWWALAVGAWLFALGGHGPLFPVLLRLAPALATFRHQERAAVVVSLALAVAAALSLQAAVARRREVGAVFAALWALATLGAAVALWRFDAPALADALTFTALVAVAAAVVCLAPGRFPAHTATLALVALTAFDLLSVNRGHALGPPGAAAPDAAADPRAAALLPHARDGRVSSEGRLAAGPNAASVLGLYDVTGDSPLHFRSIDDLVATAPEIVWWKILGVRYAVTEPRADAAALLRPLADIAGDGAGVFEVQLPGRMAWVAPDAAVATGPWRPDAAFDPYGGAVLDAPRDVAAVPERVGERPRDASWQAPLDDGTARLIGLDPNRIAVEAQLATTATVVVASAHDAGGGWRAVATRWRGRSEGDFVGISQPPVVRVYGAVLGVHLGPGRWRIEWTYRPRSVTLGALVSWLGLVGLVALLGEDRWRERRTARRSG